MGFYVREAELPLEPPEERPVCQCGKCQGEVWHGEKMIVVDDKTVCTDCFEDMITTMARRNTAMLAELFGYDVIDAEDNYG